MPQPRYIESVSHFKYIFHGLFYLSFSIRECDEELDEQDHVYDQSKALLDNENAKLMEEVNRKSESVLKDIMNIQEAIKQL